MTRTDMKLQTGAYANRIVKPLVNETNEILAIIVASAKTIRAAARA